MKKLFALEKIYISKSKILNAGRGVYANKNIKKGEIIEKCPVIQVSQNDMANLKERVLVTYFFYFGKNNKRLLVALGFGSIYNHAHKPNAKYKIKPLENAMEFVALSDIKKDEEITINYSNKASRNKNSLWFEASSSFK